MSTNLRARLERLEQATIPKGRVFRMFDDSNQFVHYDGLASKTEILVSRPPQ